MDSNTNQNNNISSEKEIFDEYYNSIKESYKIKSSRFNQVLIIWLGFTLIFFLLILFPYYSIQIKNYNTTNLLKTITTKINGSQEQMKPYQAAVYGIENLKQDINDFPYRLHDYITTLVETENVPTSGQQQQAVGPISFSNCPDFYSGNQDRTFVQCNAMEKAKELLANYNITLFEQVIASLEKIDENVQNIINISSLKLKTNDLQKSFNNTLISTPELYESYPRKVYIANELQIALNNYWDEYHPLVEYQIQKIQPNIDKLSNEKDELGIQLNLLNDTKQQIEKRIDQIEFPFGRLPIGINDSIYLFPIGIAVGYILIVSIISDKFKLRQDLFQFYEKKDHNKLYFNNFNFPKIFPIWIDRLNRSKFIKSMKFLILLLPFIVFLISWHMIDNIWAIDNSNNIDNIIFGDKTLNRYVYQISYLIIVGIFIYGYIKIIYEYKKYNRILSSNTYVKK